MCTGIIRQILHLNERYENVNLTRTKYQRHDETVMENLGNLLRDTRNDWIDVTRDVQENCPMCKRTYLGDEDPVIHAASEHHFLKIGQYLHLNEYLFVPRQRASKLR